MLWEGGEGSDKPASAWGRCLRDSAKALRKFMSFWKHEQFIFCVWHVVDVVSI